MLLRHDYLTSDFSSYGGGPNTTHFGSQTVINGEYTPASHDALACVLENLDVKGRICVQVSGARVSR